MHGAASQPLLSCTRASQRWAHLQEVSALNHEVLDDSVHRAVLVAHGKAVLPAGKSAQINDQHLDREGGSSSAGTRLQPDALPVFPRA